MEVKVYYNSDCDVEAYIVYYLPVFFVTAAGAIESPSNQSETANPNRQNPIPTTECYLFNITTLSFSCHDLGALSTNFKMPGVCTHDSIDATEANIV